MMQLLLLVLPAAVLACFFLKRVNAYYAILGNDWISQAIYFTIGCSLAVITFRYRFRFLPISLGLAIVLSFIYQLVQRLQIGEFDSFYAAITFYIFSILFLIGWLAGYGFSRSRNVSIIWSTLLLLLEIALVSRTSDITVSALISGIVPILIYSFYSIYTAELIRNTNENETQFTFFIGKRLVSFALLIFILLIGLLSYFKSDFQAVEKAWGGAKGQTNQDQNGNNGESMTQKNKEGGLQNKDQTRLSGSLNKDKQLVFVAKLDHFFESTKIPNPLYFTSHYFTRFDTLTQTFEVDENLPHNDLFKPDPSKIPLYFKESDTNIISQSLATRDRKVIAADVYKVGLAPESFVAPSTAFYCQPISVPEEYKNLYRSAYTTKMWVSDLNSAYFIYNPAGNTELEKFQELRFAKLRAIEQIKSPDKPFETYYTYMPANAEYKRITALAQKITQNAAAPIDKIIAIRDYFLSKDEFNQPLFKYSDNPGIPGIPSASKLNYFLFENRKGYCAYYAGATLFMLRSLGIPSRLAAGFLATDRSSKNPGWYWFYADQAHAWVQVYFQGYGWIDFDTTVPDVNTQQAPQPDGTPPTDVPATYLVVEGQVNAIDTLRKRIVLQTKRMLYHDTEFVASQERELNLDVSLARLLNDTGNIGLSAIKAGMRLTAVSRAEVLKTLFTQAGDNFETLVKRLPNPIPIDELKLQTKTEEKKAKEKEKKTEETPFNWFRFLYLTLGVLVGLTLIIFLLPFLIGWVLHLKAKSTKGSIAQQAFAKHRALIYYLNQMGYAANSNGPHAYAKNIDERFQTQLAPFMAIYQKLKYSTQGLTEAEQGVVTTFYTTNLKQLKKQLRWKHQLLSYLTINRTFQFFSKPK